MYNPWKQADSYFQGFSYVICVIHSKLSQILNDFWIVLRCK